VVAPGGGASKVPAHVNGVVPDDVESRLAWVREKPTISRYLAASRQLRPLTPPDWPLVRVAVLRNFTIEPIEAYLCVKGASAGIAVDVRIGGYDTAMRDSLMTEGWLFDYQPDIVIIALSLENLAPTFFNRFLTLSPSQASEAAQQAVSFIRQIVSALRERTTATIAIHNFALPRNPIEGLAEMSSMSSLTSRIRSLNQELVALASGMGNVFIVDFERMAERTPIDARNWLVARAPFTPSILEELSDVYARILRARAGRSRKVLVLDCDGTLWGGIIGEDHIGGIRLGEAYPGSSYIGLQEAALNLSKRGVLLALCSANNEADVDEVFDHHPSMVLRKSDISARRVNWIDKATNLREIASDLNLGLDSLVFVDDDPHQCEMVRTLLPAVLVVQLPPEPTEYRAAIESLDCFDAVGLTDEDRRRVELYRSEEARAVARQSASSLDAYYRSLEMVAEVGRIDEVSATRIAQLTQKTNQFNLTTRRYTTEELLHLSRQVGVEILSIRVRDRFGDTGLVGVAILVPGAHADEAEIDTFLLSCRVLGRGVEDVLLHATAMQGRAMGYRSLRGSYVTTARNQAVATFYPDHGFSPHVEDDTSWSLMLGEADVAVPAWFATIALPGNPQIGALTK
jgi:FkbH-like protein